MYIQSYPELFFNGKIKKQLDFQTINYYTNMSRRMMKWLKENQPEILI
jgi:hypothetical protein